MPLGPSGNRLNSGREPELKERAVLKAPPQVGPSHALGDEDRAPILTLPATGGPHPGDEIAQLVPAQASAVVRAQGDDYVRVPIPQHARGVAHGRIVDAEIGTDREIAHHRRDEASGERDGLVEGQLRVAGQGQHQVEAGLRKAQAIRPRNLWWFGGVERPRERQGGGVIRRSAGRKQHRLVDEVTGQVAVGEALAVMGCGSAAEIGEVARHGAARFKVQEPGDEQGDGHRTSSEHSESRPGSQDCILRLHPSMKVASRPQVYCFLCVF
nr:hypothetical protein NG677_01510 [Methylobacterium sp. OTU13CASTA1]